MDDKLEKKIKEFLPYIIITGFIYLFAPAILVFLGDNGSMALNQIIYIGLFPLTAFSCCLYYSWKKRSDFLLSVIAPVLYIPSMLLYGNINDSVVNCIIFIVSYFVCGYLGLLIGDMLRVGKKSQNHVDDDEALTPEMKERARKNQHLHRASVTAHESAVPIQEQAKNPSAEQIADETADDSERYVNEYEPLPDNIDDDIDLILDEIRHRHEE